MKRKSKKMYKFVTLIAFKGFDGDGLSCKSVVGCHINPIVCDPNADCVLIDGVHQCLCRKHFFGDGHTCTGKRNHLRAFLVQKHEKDYLHNCNFSCANL